MSVSVCLCDASVRNHGPWSVDSLVDNKEKGVTKERFFR